MQAQFLILATEAARATRVMARKLRVEDPGAIYYVMNRGVRGECDRLKRGQNGLAQPAPPRFAHQISNDESGERGSDNDK